MIGIGPSANDKPNLINVLFKQGKIGANIATLYLSWSNKAAASKLDIGIQNSDYIKGDWYQHDFTFISSSQA